MNFQNAIRSGFKNYVNVNGRASRAEYWFWVLFMIIFFIVASVISPELGSLAFLVCYLPLFTVAVRRMHDTDHDGIFILVPIYNLILLLRQSGLSENRYGPPPPPALN